MVLLNPTIVSSVDKPIEPTPALLGFFLVRVAARASRTDGFGGSCLLQGAGGGSFGAEKQLQKEEVCPELTFCTKAGRGSWRHLTGRLK